METMFTKDRSRHESNLVLLELYCATIYLVTMVSRHLSSHAIHFNAPSIEGVVNSSAIAYVPQFTGMYPTAIQYELVLREVVQYSCCGGWKDYTPAIAKTMLLIHNVLFGESRGQVVDKLYEP